MALLIDFILAYFIQQQKLLIKEQAGFLRNHLEVIFSSVVRFLSFIAINLCFTIEWQAQS
jgi:hydrogenase-4 membrane subunit HyfE